MQPMLRQGKDSVTLTAPPEKLSRYDIPLYQRKNGQYILHRVVQTGDTYTCIGDNQYYREEGIDHSQILAVVSAFQRGNREYSVTDCRYLAYCRFWCWIFPLRKVLYLAGNGIRRWGE